MKRTRWLQETRQMRFEEAYFGWRDGRWSQREASRMLGVSDRTFRRYIVRYKAEGFEGLLDRRLTQPSHRRVSEDEVRRLEDLYRDRYEGWNVRHFFSFYHRMHGGSRSYSWVKNKLQEAGLVRRCRGRGKHRKRRARAPIPGMLLHQDGSTHEWVPGYWWDLIVTMDDATNEHYSMFFVDEEGTASSFLGVRDVIEKKGLFCSLYTDRGSHYWITPKAGGGVDKDNLTQFGRAMHQLGIEMIPAYSPEARGRSERAFRTHQNRLPKELASAGITDMAHANQYISDVYLPAFNEEFMRPASESGTGFVPLLDRDVIDILCEQHERTVGNDNCVSFEGKTLQIPSNKFRIHYVRARVRVHRYPDGQLAIFHGSKKLAEYDTQGQLTKSDTRGAA